MKWFLEIAAVLLLTAIAVNCTARCDRCRQIARINSNRLCKKCISDLTDDLKDVWGMKKPGNGR